MTHPKIVTRAEWEAARLDLLTREKAATRALDALSAERRRMPMFKVAGDYVFHNPRGEHRLIDLFEGRKQLIVYHNMLAPDSGHICKGCSLYGDGIGNLAHLRASQTAFVMVSRATVPEIERVKARLGWTFPWYSCYGTTFHDDFVSTGGHSFGLSVFFCEAGDVFQTYFTTARGIENATNTFQLLDLTPFGRQEDWESSPTGWPQRPTHSWERLNDEYDSALR